MTTWKDIPADGQLDAADRCVLVRRRNERTGWSVAIAYKTVSGYWLTESALNIETFDQWCDIPG